MMTFVRYCTNDFILISFYSFAKFFFRWSLASKKLFSGKLAIRIAWDDDDNKVPVKCKIYANYENTENKKITPKTTKEKKIHTHN